MNLDDLDGLFGVDTTEATTVAQRGGDVAPLEAGVYEAIAVGLTRRKMKQSDGTLKDVTEVVWQVVDAGNTYYIRSKSFQNLNMNNEKSNFFVMMKGIAKLTGTTDPTVNQKLEALGVSRDVNGTKKILPSHLIGLSCRVTTGTQTSARTQKEYPTIIGYNPSRLAEATIKPDSVSEKLLKWEDGDTCIVSPLITVKEAKAATAPATLPVAPAPKDEEFQF